MKISRGRRYLMKLVDVAIQEAQDLDRILAMLKAGMTPTIPEHNYKTGDRCFDTAEGAPVLHCGKPIGFVNSFDGKTANVTLWCRYAGIETNEDGSLAAIEITP